MKLSNFRKSNYLIVLAIILLVFIDLSSIDSILYKNVCRVLSISFYVTCPDFYDLPFWEVTVSVGTIATAYFAFAAIKQAIKESKQAAKQSNKQLEIEQTPYVVLRDRITTVTGGHVHTMSLANIGRGMAANVTASTDPSGNISIIDGSNPHSIDFASGGVNSGWALDDGQFIRGLAQQGIKIKSNVLADIPDENGLAVKDKDKADFYVYLRYQDQIGHTYITRTKIRHSGSFLKVMENKVQKT